MRCNRVFNDVPILIEGKEFIANFIEFELGDLDVILGMDFLCHYGAEIRCQSQKIGFVTPKGECVTYWRYGKPNIPRIISEMKLGKYV